MTLKNNLEIIDDALATADKRKGDAVKKKAAAHEEMQQACKESQKLHSEQIKMEGQVKVSAACVKI